MEHFEQQLQTLWQQGGRDIALSFLRRAVSMDMPLGRLLAALNFRDVNHHLGSITLREVLMAKGDATGDGGATEPAVTAARKPAAGKRKRRSAEELTAIRTRLAELLVAEPGSLNTSQLVAALASEGQAVDSMKVNALLRTLEKDAYVVDLSGKPKSWRATAKLRASSGQSSK